MRQSRAPIFGEINKVFMKTLLLAVFFGQVFMHCAIAQNAESTASSGFSFDVYGDSRSMITSPTRQIRKRTPENLWWTCLT